MQLTVSKLQLLLFLSAQQSVHHLANGFLASHIALSPTLRNKRTFVPAATRSLKSRSSTRLMGSLFDEDDDEDDYTDESLQASSETLEKAREQFEQMISLPNDNKEPEPSTEKEIYSSSSMDEDERFTLGTKTISTAVLSNRHSPPPLTAILRERRLKEIHLLSSLAYNQDATNELWALWIGERGPEAAQHIMHAEGLIAVESWNEAELVLLSLIEEHGIHWAEPVNRLATLYYMQGRIDEARALCELVLETKPWHFGALSGIVMVCTAQSDAAGARFWAEKRLPPPGDRRTKWTEEATGSAHESLSKASLVGRDKGIGQDEVEFRMFRAQLEVFVTSEDEQGFTNESAFDAWQ